ncbi:unnamed protein product [Taenia asiatica]|uniref:IRS-type PTB domain-containing protein n=1 Tax=Taenia asiatica TaxID=60517 RepID=A0A0R3W9Q4_TAEAS|nr:unnamed protein product [Taenia asiatica]
MSVAITHTSRFYSRNGGSGPRYPPEFTCSAVLLERKFVASHGPPPPIDADRLARTIIIQKGTQRGFNVCAFRDRLLLQSLNKGSDLPEIFFDDIVQIELLSSKQNILFILCGRRRVGCYYFFKIVDYGMGNRIKELAGRANPNLMHSREGYGPSMHKSLRCRMYERQPPKENVYAYDNQRMERDCSAPPSVFSDDSNAASAFSLNSQNSFIGWEGYRRNQGADFSRSVQGKQSSVNPYRNSSRSISHSPRKSNEKTLYIKAQGVPSRRKANSMRRKRQPLVVLGDNQPRSKPVSRPATRSDKRKRGPRFANAQQKSESSKRPNPRTFILDGRPGPNYKGTTIVRRAYGTQDKSESSESTYDLADEVQIDLHPYPHESRLRNVDYEVEEIDEYDWESIDSWDLADGKSYRRLQGINFKVPRSQGRQPKNDAYSIDEESNSSVDSLYLERDMECGTKLPQRRINYLPELEEKFHQFNLS